MKKSAKSHSFSDSDKFDLFNQHPTNNSLVVGQDHILKLYRKIDSLENKEFEMLNFLNNHSKFKNVPDLVSKLSYNDLKGSYTLGILEGAVEFQETGWDYLTDITQSFFDRLLTHADLEAVNSIELEPSTNYQDLSPLWQQLFGADLAERIWILGQRTAQMHWALASGSDQTGFEPESFTLHYQRSLFASLQTLTRSTFQVLAKSGNHLPDEIGSHAREVLELKATILNQFKEIYSKKIECPQDSKSWRFSPGTGFVDG